MSTTDDEIRYVGMRGSLRVRKSKAFGLTSVLLHGRVAVEQQGQLTFLKGFTLDRFISFAGDSVAQVVAYGRNTSDIACWWLAFEGHA